MNRTSIPVIPSAKAACSISESSVLHKTTIAGLADSGECPYRLSMNIPRYISVIPRAGSSFESREVFRIVFRTARQTGVSDRLRTFVPALCAVTLPFCCNLKKRENLLDSAMLW